MIVYIEYAFLNNFLIDYIILKCTEKLTRKKAKFKLLICFSTSILALIFPILRLNMFIELILKIFIGVFIVLICFKFNKLKDFLYIFSWFMFLTLILGGVCYLLQDIFKVSLPLWSIFLIALTIGTGVFKALDVLLKKRAISCFLYKVTLCYKDKIIKVSAYLDSGNTLTDPVTNKPVVIIGYGIFKSIFNIPIDKILTKSINKDVIEGAHYIEVNTLSSGTSMLIFNLDKLIIEGNGENLEEKNVAVGLSLTSFDRAFDANVLLHPEILKQGA